MTLATLIAMIAIALSQWGATPIAPIEPRIETIGWVPAVVGCDTACRIYADPAEMAAYSPAQQQSIITHEVGHTLGLGHYGDCNYQPSIMGCATLGEITPLDRFMLARAQGRTYRLYVAY